MQDTKQETKIEDLVICINKNFRAIENEEEFENKQLLMQKNTEFIQQLEKNINKMDYGYKQDRLLKQLKQTKQKMSRIQADMKEQLKFVNRISRNSIDTKNYKFNARMSVQQNVLRSVLWNQVTTSQLLIKNEEIQQIAKRMQQNKEIIDEIHNIIKQQDEQIDEMTSNIEKTHQNVIKANENMNQAKKLQEGHLIYGRFFKLQQKMGSMLFSLKGKISGYFRQLFKKKQPIEKNGSIASNSTKQSMSNENGQLQK